MKTTYQFRDGSHLNGDAQAVGERLENLTRRGAGLTAERVLDDARAPASVLHPFFEWDDGAAAEKYRLGQAGHLIRCVSVVFEEPETAEARAAPRVVRAFLPVQKVDGERAYETTAVALADTELRRQVLAQAHGELGAVARKYRELQELAEIVSAIDRVGELLQTAAA